MYTTSVEPWAGRVTAEKEVRRYLEHGKDFVDEDEIERLLRESRDPEPQRVRDILARSLALQRLEPAETAALLNVKDEDLWQEVFETARQVKNRVYGPRIVTFAPLYCSNLCVNSCLYCAFRRENTAQRRRRLTIAEVRKETEALVSVGHKRLIVVYGEHPDADLDYISETIRAIYDTKVDHGEIRRVNINAAPRSTDELRVLKEIGIGTFQVFQETYHHATYRKVHPRGIKADYRWRLYALHRAQDAGVDDVSIGALFGLYDWKFEVMGLLYHTIDLEKKFGGGGPHTISFPRLVPAANTPFAVNGSHKVSDRDFRRLVAVIRVSVPYTGMILTAREPAEIRREVINLGCTQTDASTRIGIGAYHDRSGQQEAERQQFLLGDTRDLDEVVRELAEMGQLTSFCTAGYRCGRTGSTFMNLAKQGKVHCFCIPNAILTFQEYLLDYASEATRSAGEALIEKRIRDVPQELRTTVRGRLDAIKHGTRDVYF